MFYGSQTGTAEDFASRIAKECLSYGLNAMVADIEEYDMNNLDRIPKNHLAVFCLATYGEGEPTDNAIEFWEFLFDEAMGPEFSQSLDGQDEKPLSNLNYVVFGLGNKTYEHFNAVARKVDARLQGLGATRIGDRGEGDDDANIEEDFLTWKETMWLDACSAFGLKKSDEADVIRPPQYMVNELSSDYDGMVYRGELSQKPPK